MPKMIALTEAMVNPQFARLEALLPYRLLDTEKGGKRIASPDEFMLMSLDNENTAGFKHRDTRNYVYVKYVRDIGEDFLYVPRTDQNFHRGTFDTFED